jgi:alpha-tubulin suppressor-like RCC1 family protein
VQGLPGESCATDGGTGDGGPTKSCATEVALGRKHACALRDDGTVWCAGDNTHGQLANGNAGASATFVQIPDIAGATALSSGWGHSCAVLAGGSPWCWGENGDGQLGAAGGPAPVQVTDTGGAPLANVVELAAGGFFTCARESDGSVLCWGAGTEGEMGDGLLTSRTAAGTVPGIPAAATVATGRDHVCILGTDGTVWCWGADPNGEIGDGNRGMGVTRGSPFQVPLAMSAKQIATGTFHTCALLVDTSLWCWGANWQQELGVNNGGADTPVPTAVQIPGGGTYTGAASIAAGGAVTFAVMPDGRVDAWGDSVHGQTGNGAGGVFPSPVQLESVSRIVSHFAHACAVRTDGTIRCWGRNSEGALGNGTFTNVGFPEPLASICP